MMAKTGSIFTEAKKLRAKFPKKFPEWKDYVKYAAKLREKLCSTTVPVKKKGKKKKHRIPTVNLSGVGSVKPATVAGLKAKARKMVEEQLAWLLLARDQEKGKRARVKLSKKVALKRQELYKLR